MAEVLTCAFQSHNQTVPDHKFSNVNAQAFAKSSAFIPDPYPHDRHSYHVASHPLKPRRRQAEPSRWAEALHDRDTYQILAFFNSSISSPCQDVAKRPAVLFYWPTRSALKQQLARPHLIRLPTCISAIQCAHEDARPKKSEVAICQIFEPVCYFQGSPGCCKRRGFSSSWQRTQVQTLERYLSHRGQFQTKVRPSHKEKVGYFFKSLQVIEFEYTSDELRPIVIASDDDDDNVYPNNHDNDEGIVLPELGMASQSGSPSSLHDVSRVNMGRRDSARSSTRPRTPSRGRTRYRFSSLRGPSKKRYPRPSSKHITRERSPTKEMSTPVLRVPASPNTQRHTFRAEGSHRKSRSRDRTSSERTEGGLGSPILGEPYVAGERLGGHQDEQRGYVPKGAYLVRKEPNSDQYRFPKASAKPQPTWVTGDGFSDAEAKPDFLFFVTGKRKRRPSSSLPGIGKLTTRMDATKSPSIRAHAKRARKDGAYQQKSELLRGEKRDMWPTRHDFIDSTLPRRDEKAMNDCSVDGSRGPNTPISPPAARNEPQSTLKFKWRGKGPLDFRNFETEEVTRSSLLSDLRRVRAWREGSSPCTDDDGDEDGDALMSDRGSQASGVTDTGNGDEDDDSIGTNSKYSDTSFWVQFGRAALPGNVGQGKGESSHEYSDEGGI